jgi:hypothetical protein
VGDTKLYNLTRGKRIKTNRPARYKFSAAVLVGVIHGAEKKLGKCFFMQRLNPSVSGKRARFHFDCLLSYFSLYILPRPHGYVKHRGALAKC